jgi:demethylmenaquinone methyltransferase/2-methoxy-6-polyprenyl-1,4-benzoquinol methylase
MFGSITEKYDFLNHLLSMNTDKRWRRAAVKMMDLSKDTVVLDLATGTADVAIEIMNQSQRGLDVVGVDFTQGMLKLAIEKTRDKKDTASFNFVNAPAESLPLKDNMFDYCTIAFGIRNVVDRQTALKEMVRVLKPGGGVIILEFSKPKNRLFNALYDFYFLNVLPVVGGVFSKMRAYKYLPDSVFKFPANEAFMDMMRDAGFHDVKVKPLTFGIASIYSGKRDVGSST